MKLLLKIHHESPRIHDIFLYIFNRFQYLYKLKNIYLIDVTLAEWLTRWPAKPFPFGSAGSSPAGDDSFLSLKYFNFFNYNKKNI